MNLFVQGCEKFGHRVELSGSESIYHKNKCMNVGEEEAA